MEPLLEIPHPVPSLASGELHVWRLCLAASEAQAKTLHALLSPEEHQRAGRFRFERDRLGYVAAHAGLRLVLAGYLGCAPAEVLMEPGALGKPLLAGPVRLRATSSEQEPGLAFNLSHSGAWGLLAVGRQAYIGADIEAHRDLPDLPELAGSVLTPAEQAVLDARAPDRRLVCFFQMWTRKEAVVKAAGAGLGSALDSIEIEPADPALGATFRAIAGLPDMPVLYGRSLDLAAGYSAAVACESPSMHVRVLEGG